MINLRENIWASELPEGAINPVIDMGYLIFKVPNYSNWCTNDIMADYGKLQKYLKAHKAEDDYKTGGTPLPPGNWKIICTSKEVLEDQAANIVQVVSNGKISGRPQYRRYDRASSEMPARMWTRDARHSFETLLAYRGLDAVEKNYLIIQKM